MFYTQAINVWLIFLLLVYKIHELLFINLFPIGVSNKGYNLRLWYDGLYGGA